MSLQNRISLKFTDEELQKIRAANEIYRTVVKPKLIQLTPEDRQQMAKMGDKTMAFVTKGIEHAEKHPEFTPKYFDLEETKIDFNAVVVLREISNDLGSIAQMVDDTMTLSGSEAYLSVLSFYSTVKVAAKDNQPGAQQIYDDLKSRFPKGSSVPQANAEKVVA